MLQSLVLIELIVSSSSQTVYILSGAGIGMILFFMFLVKDDAAKKSLAVIYPSLLVLSTSLLSVVTLLKVLLFSEQTDLSLVFLGVAFTSDNLLLVLEFVPRYSKYILAGRNSFGRRGSLEEVMDAGWFGNRCNNMQCSTLSTCQDYFVLFTLFLIMVVSSIIFTAHILISGSIFYCLKKAGFENAFNIWGMEENQRRKNNEPVPIAELSKNEIAAIFKKTRFTIVLFISVLVVDVEFLAVAISMAVVSGGSRIGGIPIGNGTNC